MAGPFGLFGPGDMGGAPGGITGTRSTQGYQPTPNSEPMGSITGVPVRTRAYALPLVAGSNPIVIAPGTRENKVVLITPPDVGFMVFVGDSGVTPLNGFALIPGTQNEFPLPGFQELYAVTNAPVTLIVQITITPILLAERERRL